MAQIPSDTNQKRCNRLEFTIDFDLLQYLQDSPSRKVKNQIDVRQIDGLGEDPSLSFIEVEEGWPTFNWREMKFKLFNLVGAKIPT